MRTIRLMATLRDIAGGATITVNFQDGGTVRDLINSIGDVCPEIADSMLDENGELTGLVHVFVTGRSVVWLDGLDTVISADDELLLVPPIAGG